MMLCLCHPESHLHVIIAMLHFAPMTGSQVLFNQTSGLCYSSTFVFSSKVNVLYCYTDDLSQFNFPGTSGLDHVTFINKSDSGSWNIDVIMFFF